MTIDDIKIDELEHFAQIFREVDLQIIRQAEPEQALWYINAMLNTYTCQQQLAAFRWQKLVTAVGDAFRCVAKTLSNVFSGIAEAFRRIGNE